MSELRARMIRDMAVRGFSPRTHEAYIAAVVHLAKYYKRAPDQLTNDEVQAYLAHMLQERKLSWSTCSQAAHAFRFLYHVTLGHDRAQFLVPAPRQPQKLPEILSREEVWRLLNACTRVRDRLAALRHHAWVVYCKPPFAGPEHVLAYLGRYTHRVAISSDRLVGLDDGRVRFRWRDYADGDRTKVMELEAPEFLRRFLLHVVPDGFVRIRHFGLLANRRRAANVARCHTLLAQAPLPPRCSRF